MDKNELFNEIYKSLETRLTQVSGSHWNIIKNATIGKELITVAATVYFEYLSRLLGYTTVFNYKTIPASGLVDLANFVNVPLSWIRPTTLYAKNINNPIGQVEITIGSSTFVGMCRFPGETVRFYKFSSKKTIDKSTIQIGDSTVEGYKVDKAILPFISIKDSDGKSWHLFDSTSNSGIEFTNLKDKSIFIEGQDLTIQCYIPDTDPSDITAEAVKALGYEFISVNQGEESDEVARCCIQQYTNFAHSLASEKSIIEAVNADINVVDCKVSVENKTVRVYCKPSEKWSGGVDYLAMELNTRGILGYNYYTSLANKAEVVLLIKGNFDSSQRTAIETMISADYSYNKTKFDWIPSILELKSKIEAVTGEYNFDLSFKVATQATPNLKYKPIEGSIKVKQLSNGWTGGYDKDGIIYVVPNMGIQQDILFSGSQIGYWSPVGTDSSVGDVSFQGDVTVPGVMLYCNTAKMLGVSGNSNIHAYTFQGITMVVSGLKVTVYNSESFTQKNVNLGVPIIRTYTLDSSYTGVRNDVNIDNNHLAVSRGKFVSRPLCYIQSYLYCNEVENNVSTIVRYSTTGIREKIIQVGELGGCRGCHFEGGNLFVFYDVNPSEASPDAIALVLYNLGELDQYAQVYNCSFQHVWNIPNYTLFDVIEIVTGEIYVVVRDLSTNNNKLLFIKTTGFAVVDNRVTFNTVVDLGSSMYETSEGDSMTYQVVDGGIITASAGGGNVLTLHKDDGTTVNLSNIGYYNCNNPQSVGTVNYDTGEITIQDSWSVQFRSISLIKNDNTYIVLSPKVSYE